MNISKLAFKRGLLAAGAIATALLGTINAQAENKNTRPSGFETPGILVLGDSQLSFGAGEVILDLFDNIASRCSGKVDHDEIFAELEKMRTTLVGTRSTSLQSWISTKGRSYNRICKKDKTWGVNASIWGHLGSKKRRYVQIGEHKPFDFCEKNERPINVLFEMGYMPQLLVFNLVGNDASRIAKDSKSAHADVMKIVDQLPSDVACVFMTTVPIHTPRRNKVRKQAQANLRDAFAAHGDRCSFVGTFDETTVGYVQGKNKFFRRKKNGRVKDPFHPNKHAAKLVYEYKSAEICQAVADAFRPKIVADSNELELRDAVAPFEEAALRN